MGKEHINKRLCLQAMTALVYIVMFIMMYPTNIFAESEKTTVIGKVYEFDKGDDYEFSGSDKVI